MWKLPERAILSAGKPFLTMNDRLTQPPAHQTTPPITQKFADYPNWVDTEVFKGNNPLAYLDKAKLGTLEQKWVACLAQLKNKFYYKRGKLNGHANALSHYPVERLGEDVDSCQEDIEVAPVLLTMATSCSKDRELFSRWNPLKFTAERNGCWFSRRIQTSCRCSASFLDAVGLPPVSVRDCLTQLERF